MHMEEDTRAPVSIAPMMEWTDRDYRYFMRRITRHTVLYTEMVTARAILFGDPDHLLRFHKDEHPLVLQLGGDEPEELARAIEIAEQYGYDGYNLNVGCPSERVQSGNFGACLMADPNKVAELTVAMRGATDKPVSIKHRIGIEWHATYEGMRAFVDSVAATEVSHFIVHARVAILGGLNPKQNRSVPPIRYDEVYRLKQERPDLHVEINGQIRTPEDMASHLSHVDGVMIGRGAYENPWMMSTVDQRFFGAPAPPCASRHEVVERMVPYIEELEAQGVSPRRVFTHMLGLFAGVPGARRWRQGLSGRLPAMPAVDILRRAAAHVPEEVLK